MGTSGRFGSLNDRLHFNSRRSGEIRLDTARTRIGEEGGVYACNPGGGGRQARG